MKPSPRTFLSTGHRPGRGGPDWLRNPPTHNKTSHTPHRQHQAMTEPGCCVNLDEHSGDADCCLALWANTKAHLSNVTLRDGLPRLEVAQGLGLHNDMDGQLVRRSRRRHHRRHTCLHSSLTAKKQTERHLLLDLRLMRRQREACRDLSPNCAVDLYVELPAVCIGMRVMAIRVACSAPLLFVIHILAVWILSFCQSEHLAHTLRSLCDPNGVQRSF